MRVRRAVVEIAVLAMVHPWEEFPLRRAIAVAVVRDDHPRDVSDPLESRAEQLLRCRLVAPTLPQDVEPVARLIHCPPQRGPLGVDGEQPFIQGPLIPRLRPSVSTLSGRGVAKLAAPLPERFIGHDHATGEPQLFAAALAETQAEVQPDALADDCDGQTMTMMRSVTCSPNSGSPPTSGREGKRPKRCSRTPGSGPARAEPLGQERGQRSGGSAFGLCLDHV
jgi:hypothetical protein